MAIPRRTPNPSPSPTARAQGRVVDSDPERKRDADPEGDALDNAVGEAEDEGAAEAPPTPCTSVGRPSSVDAGAGGWWWGRRGMGATSRSAPASAPSAAAWWRSRAQQRRGGGGRRAKRAGEGRPWPWPCGWPTTPPLAPLTTTGPMRASLWLLPPKLLRLGPASFGALVSSPTIPPASKSYPATSALPRVEPEGDGSGLGSSPRASLARRASAAAALRAFSWLFVFLGGIVQVVWWLVIHRSIPSTAPINHFPTTIF